MLDSVQIIRNSCHFLLYTVQYNTIQQSISFQSIHTDECQTRTTLSHIFNLNIQIIGHKSERCEYSKSTKYSSEHIHKWHNQRVCMQIVLKLKWKKERISQTVVDSLRFDDFILYYMKQKWPKNCIPNQMNRIIVMQHLPKLFHPIVFPILVLRNKAHHWWLLPVSNYESNENTNFSRFQIVSINSNANLYRLTKNAVKMTYGKMTVKNTVLPAPLMPFDKQKNATNQPAAKHSNSCHRG